MDGGSRPSKAEREQTAEQVEQFTAQGILPAEQRAARVRLARGARSHEDLQHALDPDHELPAAHANPRAVIVAAVMAALVALGVAIAVLAAGGGPPP